jgi:IclR family acetate operon transcriptional repressor
VAARPDLVALAERSREAVHLAVIDGGEVVNVDQVAGPHIVGHANWVGRKTPLHCVANGKVLLAYGDGAALDRVLAAPLARFTERTITEPERLRAELAAVRRRGYATAMGEIEEGLNAVAAPIYDAGGQVVAAVSVSGPSYRVKAKEIVDLAALTVEAADHISARLGYSG